MKFLNKVKTGLSLILVFISFLLTLPFLPLAMIKRNIFGPFVALFWGRFTFWSSLNGIHCIGLENLEFSEGENVLYISNHQSYLDIPVLFGWVDYKAVFIARESLTKVPLFGFWLKVIGCEFLERKATRKELGTIVTIGERIAKGDRFFLFPEGTRSKDGQLQKFKRSTRRLFEGSDVSIVPVYISGTNKILPPNRLWFGSSKVSVTIGEKICTRDVDPKKILGMIHEWMETMQKPVIDDNINETESIEKAS